MEPVEIIFRLGLAALAGVALGLNRDLHGKPTGVRTLGLVGVASALIVIAVGHGQGDASRVIQGIVTGIGFLGAGVIVRSERGKHVHNLTTAACVWLTACAGAACGAGEWLIVLIAAPIVVAILAFGGPLERWIHRLWPEEQKGGVTAPTEEKGGDTKPTE